MATRSSYSGQRVGASPAGPTTAGPAAFWAVRVLDGSTELATRRFEGQLVVGRDGSCDIVVDDERASRHHCTLATTDGGTVVVTDGGSTNGTLVNGHRLDRPTVLRSGDEVTVGRHRLTLLAVTALATPPPGSDRNVSVTPPLRPVVAAVLASLIVAAVFVAIVVLAG